ncbi:MAG: pyridoxamine kinase [Bacteroidales bacterium]|nr:pyridoxamine kinase [Bacteroidales bacterium]
MKKPVPRIAAVHDLSGFGRASLTVVIPILSRMGIQVCPLPTAVLSTHSKYKGFHFTDMTGHLNPILDHWKALNVDFDGIYSGFLGSHEQIEMVKRLIRDFRKDDQLVVVDPVLGDDGIKYTTMTDDMVREMRTLIGHADVITPNLTEAALLLDKDFPGFISDDDIRAWIKELAEFGPSIIIVTSVPEQPEARRTKVIAYNVKDDRFWKVSCNYLPANYPGTGDAFASVITGSLLQGDSLPIALDRAVHFTSYGVRATFGYDYDANEGIVLERILNHLDAPVQNSSYELL